VVEVVVVAPAAGAAAPSVVVAPAAGAAVASAGAVDMVEVESVLIVEDDSVVAGVVVVVVSVEAVFDSHEARPTARNRADTFSRLFILG